MMANAQKRYLFSEGGMIKISRYCAEYIKFTQQAFPEGSLENKEKNNEKCFCFHNHIIDKKIEKLDAIVIVERDFS